MRPLAALALAAALFAPGCATPASGPAPDVLATFYPLAFLAQRIGGDDVSVGALVPAGVEPHDWEPTPADLPRLAGARVILAQGLGFEPWLDNLRAQLPRDTVAVTTAGVDAREGFEEDHEGDTHEGEEREVSPSDPHTWLDPLTFAMQAKIVEAALAGAWPEHAPAFAQRAANLTADLESLHAELEAGLSSCELDFVIANHDAYGYMAARYGFTVHAIRGLSPEAEPDVRTVAELVDLARENNVTIVFFEELASPRVAEIIARDAGAQTRVLSPVEGLSAEASSRGEDYLTLMRANLAGLKEAMRCSLGETGERGNGGAS